MLEQIGQYKILDRLGAGGMGEVYRARDTRLGRTVAVKVLPADVADDPDRRERFVREAQAAAALSHPSIAALFEIGEDQGRLFLAFEYVPGETLKTVIGGRPLHPRQALDYGIQLCDALADAHAEGIVHRDIKPANIIITPKDKAKILDFGLATWTGGGAEREHAATMLVTQAGTALGTAPYMSPEQALGERVDHRTDIFSLGVVLFEMLTGRLPFTGATPTAVTLQIVQAAAPKPSAINPSVPRELDAIVAKALAKSLDERYEAAATMGAELRGVAAILDTRDGTIEPASAAAFAVGTRRRRWPFVALILAIAAAAAVWAERDLLARQWRRAIGRGPAPVIAVVPFDTDAKQEFFADGLGEDLITRLGQTPGLKVIGRSATRRSRGKAPRDVAQELGAGVVLTGSVRRQDDVVKISLELIDAADSTSLWTGQYTREMKNIFAVQAEVAAEVAQALRVKLQPTRASERARSRSVDPKAYESYLRGRQALAERRLADAIKDFDGAVVIDAGLAEAFAGRVEAAHLETANLGAADTPLRRQQIKGDAARAYELDPDLPQANLAMGLASDSLVEALGYMRHAIDVDRSFTEGFHQIGDQIADFDPELANRFYRRSLDIDPRYEQSRIDLVASLILLDRWDDARRELDAVNPAMRPFLAIATDLDQHRFDRSIAALEALPNVHDSPAVWNYLVRALRTADRRDQALQQSAALMVRYPTYCEGLAVHGGLLLEHGQPAAAHRAADAILRAARAPGGTGADVRCGVAAAAALNDAPSLGALIDRIASDEGLLRYWALEIQGQTGRALLRGRMYPWTNDVVRTGIAASRQRLEEAYARERSVAQAKLAGALDR